MVAPAFGFSTGDFIRAIELLNDVRKALRSTGGASQRYQESIERLDNLLKILKLLQSLCSHQLDLDPDQRMWRLASTCQNHLQDFVNKQTKYWRRLSPQSDRRWSLKTGWQKVEWSLSAVKDVDELWKVIKRDPDTLELALSFQKLILDTNGHKDHLVQLQKIEASISALGLSRNVVLQAAALDQSHHLLASRLDEMQAEIIDGYREQHDLLWCRLQQHYPHSPSSSDGSVIVKTKELALVIWALLKLSVMLPLVRHLLLLWNGKYSILPIVEWQSITFEDPLGKIARLSYDTFRCRAVFQAMLRDKFEDSALSHHVFNDKFYLVVMSQTPQVLKTSSEWISLVRPGSAVRMFAVILNVDLTWMQCSHCTRKPHSASTNEPEFWICDQCKLLPGAKMYTANAGDDSKLLLTSAGPSHDRIALDRWTNDQSDRGLKGLSCRERDLEALRIVKHCTTGRHELSHSHFHLPKQLGKPLERWPTCPQSFVKQRNFLCSGYLKSEKMTARQAIRSVSRVRSIPRPLPTVTTHENMPQTQDGDDDAVTE